MAQTPTLGRVVRYSHDGKTEFAAIIACVHSSTNVNLSVIDHDGSIEGVEEVELGMPLQKHHWWWPEIVA